MATVDRRGIVVGEAEPAASLYAHSGVAVKAAVVCATTANITLSGLQTIDGVTVVADDRVLVKDQTDASENGIYNASSGTWQRSGDFDGAGEVAKGALTFVIDGTSQATTYWYVMSDNPITIGESDINFSEPAFGDVSGPASSTNENIVVFDGTTGKAIKDSGVALSDKQDVLAEGPFANGDKTKLDGIETSADVTDAVNVGSSIHGTTAKTTPVDADTLPLIDSAASNVLKKVTWANIKATIKSYYDSVTSTLSNKTINLASNTLSGTLSEFNTACSNGDFAFLGQMNTFSVTQDFQQTSAPAFIQMRRMDTAAGLRSECILDFDGTNGSGGAVDALARMEVRQTVVTAGAESGAYLFASKQGGALGTRAVFAAGVYHESASGGDLGNNTINFGAVYDDNSLLSCYPFDQYLDGRVDLKKWDGLVPDKIIPAEYVVERRDTGKKGSDGKPILEKVNVEVKPASTEKTRHEYARKFLSRIGTEYDPLTLDGYAKHWKDKRHLPAMPNEAKYDPVDGKLPTGSWVQRLVETAEVQAVLIERLNQITKDQEKRIAALEAIMRRRTA